MSAGITLSTMLTKFNKGILGTYITTFLDYIHGSITNTFTIDQIGLHELSYTTLKKDKTYRLEILSKVIDTEGTARVGFKVIHFTIGDHGANASIYLLDFPKLDDTDNVAQASNTIGIDNWEVIYITNPDDEIVITSVNITVKSNILSDGVHTFITKLKEI